MFEPFFTETDRINKAIKSGGMDELRFFELELARWKTSRQRRDMLDGEHYYRGEHDILHRKRTAISRNGKLEVVDNLPNNRIVDNQYGKMVAQKVNYLVGRPITFETENGQYASELTETFGGQFMRTLHAVSTDALCGGVGWLHPCYSADGQLQFIRFPPYEILPFWADAAHTVLDAFARLYEVEMWEGTTHRVVERAEICKRDGIYRYIFDGGTLRPDTEHPAESHVVAIGADGKAWECNWNRIPLIAWKFNSEERSLLSRTKSIQDSINLLRSDWMNNMQEDAHNTVLVINNHDGTDLGEFRYNLATFGAIKVRSDPGMQGGVNTLDVHVDADGYERALKSLKEALIENARGYDAKDERLGGSPNQMNIQSMYSDIDLDANSMETEFQAAFKSLLWFVNQHLANTGRGNFDGEDVKVIFNRDILINESQAIEDCGKSVGIISNETIVAQHPWTSDVKKELQRIEDEKRRTMDEYNGAFGTSGGGDSVDA